MNQQAISQQAISQQAIAQQTTSSDYRVHNFCAGPATLPTAVLQKAQQELLNWQNKGVSVMEISHRSDEFAQIAHNAQNNLKHLLNIGDDYQVLFLQGGASLQFSVVAMNLLHGVADYLQTGLWSKKAIDEAKRYQSLGRIHVVASGESYNYTTIPDSQTWQLSDHADYFYYCPNETVHGLYLPKPPQVTAPIVADMSSCLLSAPIDVNQFGVIYAGAQKNIGIAGLTIVIIHKQLLGHANAICPTTQNYTQQANCASMVNTPPTFAWYMTNLVLEWLIEQGGIDAIYAQNIAKAERLYRFIDGSDFYANHVDKRFRSLMNIPFRLADDRLNDLFVANASLQGLLNLQGHRSVGGMRASIYNALNQQAIDDLIEFMTTFERQNA